jgi:MarR family transcriptional regulator, transcriptional regulator for hemolysin
MDDKLKEDIGSIAREIRAQARDIKVDTFLSYLSTCDVINRYFDLLLTDSNISKAGLNVLHSLILNDGSMIPTDISRETFRSKYSVTRVIDTLEGQGLVKRNAAGRDRRTRRVDITRKGLKVVEDVTNSLHGMSQNIFKPVDGDHLGEFNDGLKKVGRHVLELIGEVNDNR